MPIDPDQLAEGRARTIARQVECEHRQRRREQPDYWFPEDVNCDSLPPRGRGRGVLRVQATLTETTPVPGAGISSSTTSTPSVGRSRVLLGRELRHTVANPGRPRNTYLLPVTPSVPSIRFEAAVFPEVTGPQLPSVPYAPTVLAATLPLFSVADPGAAWLAAAPVAETAVDSEDRCPPSPASPARSVALDDYVIPDSEEPDVDAFAALDLSGYRATDDMPSSGPVEPTSTKWKGSRPSWPCPCIAPPLGRASS